MNPVEYAFELIKEEATKNKFEPNLESLQVQITDCIKKFAARHAKGCFLVAAKYRKMAMLGLPFCGKLLSPELQMKEGQFLPPESNDLTNFDSVPKLTEQPQTQGSTPVSSTLSSPSS